MRTPRRSVKAAGAHQVHIGLESGDQGQLDNMDKACTWSRMPVRSILAASTDSPRSRR
jgi:hypothetical protein